MILFTPLRCCSHFWKFVSHHLNFDHTIYFQDHTCINLFTPSRCWSHSWKVVSHHLNFEHTIYFQDHTVIIWTYVQVQNKFIWVWLPLMDAKMTGHHRSIYKECVNVLWLQSTLNSNLCTHGVGTKQVVTWCDFVLFCYLIIPKQRGFTQKNGVTKKKNSGKWHHLVKRFMFWYLHPLKTCKLVPISLKHVRLGANQVPHSLYPNHRVESETVTFVPTECVPSKS